MEEHIFDYQFRLILVGDSMVGKSSLLRYFTEGIFDDSCEPTMGVDFFARLVDIKPNVRVKLQIWDTAGQERFRSITRSYYRDSVGVLLVYDITRRKTFEHLEGWLEESRLTIVPHKAVYVVVGHKSDVESERQVSFKEGRSFASNNGFHFFETSAVTGNNVEEVFCTIAREIYAKVHKGEYLLSDDWDGVKEGTNLALCQPIKVRETAALKQDHCGGYGSCC
ncbi:hypothetical protein HELRODRAFT_83286 [Helobdella robusta]|uniref:Ras-related protein Rab-39B n=1 Tax=Helobdella robusta TaxID=6412 RepID=T1G535_HELRO|nr:hypothetical protein HELRODRAFT_83286 [Helobdella robusta]ESO00149.1 hypothetical protein HELRODRAFT_83286 [Helobdella robusta]